MKKKVTQADRLGWQMRAGMYQTMGLLEWDMLTYTMFKYECGIGYLEASMGLNQALARQGGDDRVAGDIALQVAMVSGSAEYWGWWKLHWHFREQELLDKLDRVTSHVMGVEQYRQIYRIVHCPTDLAKCITPDGRRLEDSYCKMRF